MRLEHRIMIGAQVSGHALPMNSSIEHPADVGARHRTTVHAEADQATVNWSMTTSTQ